MANKLFTEFPPVSTEQWEEVINQDLKGADYEKKLVWRTEEGFAVRPYYRAENLKDIKFEGEMPGQFPFVRGTKCDNNWLTRQDYCLCNGIKEANKLALDGLNKGVESVGFYVGDKKLTAADFAELLNGIVLPAVEVNFCGCCVKTGKEMVENFIACVKKQGVKAEDVRASFDFSPLHMLTTRGGFCEDYDYLADIVKAVAEYPKVRVINVEGYSIVFVWSDVLCGRIRIGDGKSQSVETVSTHHATDGIAEKLLHQVVVVPDIMAATVFAFIFNVCNLSCLKYSNLVKWNIRCQFILKTIDFDELAVKFFLVLVKLVKSALPDGSV